MLLIQSLGDPFHVFEGVSESSSPKIKGDLSEGGKASDIISANSSFPKENSGSEIKTRTGGLYDVS